MMSKRRSCAPTSFQQTVIQLVVLELHYPEIFTVNTFYIYLKKVKKYNRSTRDWNGPALLSS